MKRLLFLLALVLAPACDDKDTNLVNDGDGGTNGVDGGLFDGAADGPWVDFADADPLAPDAGGSAPCSAAQAQCNNCIDDDGDGRIDGLDVECTGATDDNEDSFATGIPGDNIDPKNQDCFFDGNSGAGDDKCNIPTCCILDLSQQPNGECPEELEPNNFDPTRDCEIAPACIANCAPLTPPGCDCFGCCTICDDDSCQNIYTNPAVAPECNSDNIDDPTKCPVCTPSTECGSTCNNENCELCPGQTIDDLPAECGETQACPNELTVCTTTADCLAGQFCSNGCCILTVD